MSPQKDSGGRAGPSCGPAGIVSRTPATRRCRVEPSCTRSAPSPVKNSVTYVPDRWGKRFGSDELPGSSEPGFPHIRSPGDSSVLFLDFTAEPPPSPPRLGHACPALVRGPPHGEGCGPSRLPGAPGRTRAPEYVTFAPTRSILQTRGLQPVRHQPSSRSDARRRSQHEVGVSTATARSRPPRTVKTENFPYLLRPAEAQAEDSPAKPLGDTREDVDQRLVVWRGRRSDPC